MAEIVIFPRRILWGDMLLKDAIEIKRRTLDKEMTAARIEKELEQVWALLRRGPATAKEITAATGLTNSVALHRARAVGGVWDGESRRWRL